MPKELKKWKGKWVTDAVYNKRLKQRENGHNRKKEVRSDVGFPIKGCRIVDLEHMANDMKCKSCNHLLVLTNITDEIKKGLASILKVKCDNCLLINDVTTGKSHQHAGKHIKFDVNSKSTLGCLHTGIGHTQMEKYLSTLEIPSMSVKTFKKHEREVGKVTETVAKESCVIAAKIERSLTIEKSEELSKLLPEDKQDNFFIPTKDSSAVTESDTVKIMGCVDMGYSGRGNGFTYDSLNGYAAMIGAQSGLVVDYGTTNRMCRMCSMGHPKEDHDCRLNFYGSAKAMEASVATRLVNDSAVLKEQNLQVGVFISDNDTSSICSIRKAADHDILHFTDKNHNFKGVKNLLYAISKENDPDKELSHEAIKFLERCFSYAVHQNKNKGTSQVAAAIQNIPNHVFNHHENCGDWCGFRTDPENYEHQTIPGGFKNQKLFQALVLKFNNLAKNAQKFQIAASTQGNESLNAIMARKAPRQTSYSLSESADFRFACAVNQKNDGDKYVSHVIAKSNMEPGSVLKRIIDRNEKIRCNRKIKACTPSFKRTRRERKKKRSQLRNRKEAHDTYTYQSNIGLITENEADKENVPPTDCINPLPNITSEEYAFVYFDLETSGFPMTADILQIAMKANGMKFDKYVKPRQLISRRVTDANGLSNEGVKLFYNGQQVQTNSLANVLNQLLEFLKSLKKPCILVAHNCAFDSIRLIRAIKNENMLSDFEAIIDSFTDTLALFKKKFPERKAKGQLKLTSLASGTLALSTKNAHNADYDVYLLEKLVEHHLDSNSLINSKINFQVVLAKLKMKETTEPIIATLQPLKGIISDAMIQRLAQFNINYDLIVETFKNNGIDKTTELLKQCNNGKAQLIKNQKILSAILEHLKNV